MASIQFLKSYVDRTIQECDILRVPIKIDSKESELWYSVPKEFGPYLNIDNCNPFVVAFLIYAMQNNYNIESKLPIDEKLHFGITKYLIPFLKSINSELHEIKIVAPICSIKTEGTHVGTGISCGVDSLSTYIYHSIEEECIGYKIDTLTFLNTGYYGNDERNHENYAKFINKASGFSINQSKKFLTIDSNISNLTQYVFLSAHSYLSCSTIMVLERYFHTYYYSSGYPIGDFKADFKDSAFYDDFLLKYISTSGLSFISSCSTMNRVQKTELIGRYPDILKSLYVCFRGNPEYNCGECEKCVRTQLAFDALNMLDCISELFNLTAYKKNRSLYISYMLRSRFSNPYYRELYETFRKNKVSIPLSSWFKTIIPLKFELITFKGNLLTTSFGKTIYRIYKEFKQPKESKA